MIEAILRKRRSHTRILLSVLMVVLYPSLLFAENIPLIKKGGVYEIPVEINGVITLNFVLDTGASEVNIPADVALTLYRTGTIRDADFLPGKTYSLADGSQVNSSRFVLRSLKIGQRHITNVAASIGSISSSLLLGQSFLEKLGAWGIDSQKQILSIGTKENRELSISKQVSVPELDKLFIESQKEINSRGKNLEKIFTEKNILSYEGYDVEISSNKNIYVKMNGKTLVDLDGGKQGWDHSRVGLFNLFGDKNKQLIIKRASGNCCLTYKIYRLIPDVHLIFDDEEYFTGSITEFIDMDRDGIHEIVQFISTFNNFHGLNKFNSGFLDAIFSYDKDTDRYVVKNMHFSKYLLRNIEEYKKQFNHLDMLKNMREKNISDEYILQMLRVVLSYIYAGKEGEGWQFFNTIYKLKNKEEIRSDILKTLASDPIYKAIYGR